MLIPVHEVNRGGMPPRHTAEVNVLAIGIELVVEVPACAIEYHSVGVVYPTAARGEMILRAIFLVVYLILPGYAVILINLCQGGLAAFVA